MHTSGVRGGSPLRLAATLLTLSIAMLTLSIAVTAATGCGPEAGPGTVGVYERAIVNGQLDTGHPAVGVLHVKGKRTCTATLINPRTVLTAAHCVTDNEEPPFKLNSPVGFALGLSGTVTPASAVVMHPGYEVAEDGGLTADLTVVRLAAPIAGVKPARITSDTPGVGEIITLVGYGDTAETAKDAFGAKRKARARIGKVVFGELFYYDSGGDFGSICYGDSGGPAFAEREGEEWLVGIHSYSGEECGVGEASSQRVDSYHSWIVRESAPEEPETPPIVVRFGWPVEGSTVSPNVIVRVETEGEVEHVELYLDQRLVETRAERNPTFDLFGVAIGTHTLRARAMDPEGREGNAEVSVTVAEEAADSAGVLPDEPGMGGCTIGATRPADGVLPGLALLLVGLCLACARRRAISA